MAVKLRLSVINLVVLVILAGFLITIIQTASVESDKKKPDESVDNSKETSEKTVEDAGIPLLDRVKRWTSLASDKLPKSFSFKKPAAPASEDSNGPAEKVKGTATKGYEIGKKATQDVIDSVGQAAQKTGETIKQTAGKAHGEL